MVELILVIVLLAILAGAAVPTLDALEDRRSAVAARLLLHDLSFARQRAQSTSVTSWVVFNAGAESWTILAEDPNNPGRAGATVLADLATGRPFVQTLGRDDFHGVGIVSAAFDGQAEVGFDWLGRPLNATEALLAADGLIVLSGGHQIHVEVETGYASEQ